MQTLNHPARRGDGHLWMIALSLSLLVNLAILCGLGLAALEMAARRKNEPAPPKPATESVVMIFPETAPPTINPVPPETRKPQFANTSDDQISTPRENAPYIGERNTQATSDRAPDRNAARIPSQAGIEPRDEMDIETTESSYQDGSLDSASQASPRAETLPTPPAPAPSPPTEPAPPMETATDLRPEKPGRDTESSIPPPPEKLLEGPNPVDVPVPREAVSKSDEIKPTPEKRPAVKSPPPQPKELPKTVETPKPVDPTQPGFKGYQRKTAMVGSISRTGRSSLEVEDTPLGRYQAQISRAVEQEWQRNCVRHRDFITPGFLTVRFFVQTTGKVRSVQFVGDMETGEVQKGFTLNSIRDAGIPAMPATLRKEYDEEPLEIVFRFYF